ncbi:hypothetical protein LOD99_8403 [Oopsacas minuta]|uniref:Uncharacterized protein n=1 Tax=Oopsacas minuta TaxID=111878 RepID=A0AAV7JGL9_9METZ|nr:hypothetical protein LOD99_8403 [Oopsacas minuta]
MATVSPDESPTQIIGENGEVARDETVTKQEPTENKLNSNESNGSPTQTPVETEPVPKPKLTAEEYLEKHKINILFEELIFRTLDGTPENPLKFLLTNLEAMDKDNWVPGYSQEEKANAVSKIFKSHEADKSAGPKSIGGATRPGPAGRGSPAKTSATTTRPVGGRAPTVRPSPASKTVSSPPKVGISTGRVTNPRTGVKTTATPVVKTTATPVVKTTATPVAKTTATPVVKTTTTPVKTATNTTNRNTNSNPVKTAPAKTGITGGAVKTGSSTSLASSTSKTSITKTSSPGSASKVTNPRTATGPKTSVGAKTGTTGVRTATVGTGTKTGTNTSVTKTGGAAKTTATPRTTVRLTATTGRTPAGKTSAATKTPTGTAGRTLGTGTRAGAGRNTTKTAAATPTKGKQDTATKTEEIGKYAEPDPEPKPPTPVEEPKVPTPEEPKQPIDDGMCSKIKGGDEPEPEALDHEDQLALDDAVHLSDDENIHVAEKTPSDNESDKFPLKDLPQVTEQIDSSADKYMTSENYADDLQAIENEAEQLNQGDTLEEFIDEGIEVKDDYTSGSDPSFRLRIADEIDNPVNSIPTMPQSMGSQLGDYTAVQTGENTQITPEPLVDVEENVVEDESKKEKAQEPPQDIQPLVSEEVIITESKKDSPLEKPKDFQPLVPTDDLIGQTVTDPIQEQTTGHKFSGDLGINMNEKSTSLHEPAKDEEISTTVDLLGINPGPAQEATTEPDTKQVSSPSPIIDLGDLITVKTAEQQPNPIINDVQPPTPEEQIAQPLQTKSDAPPAPSPDQGDPLTQIEPPANTEDAN